MAGRHSTVGTNSVSDRRWRKKVKNKRVLTLFLLFLFSRSRLIAREACATDEIAFTSAPGEQQ
jgi:hypothetical protein